MRRTALVVSLLLAVACGGGVQRDDSGQIIAQGELSSFELQAGDCFLDSTAADANDDASERASDKASDKALAEVTSVRGVPCAQEHDSELFFEAEFPAEQDSEFPGADVLQQFAQQRCTGAPFTDYVGTAYADSTLIIFPLIPTEDSWGQADRAISCAVRDPAGQLTGSVRGTSR